MARPTINERWLPVAGFPGYEISDMGRVRSYRKSKGGLRQTPKMLNPYVMVKGNRGLYATVALRREGRTHTMLVHRLVLLTFVGPEPEGTECCHEDGNGLNNHLDNLTWKTHQENSKDMVRHGMSARGERHGQAKLTDDAVRAIRAMRTEGKTRREVAEQFGVSRGTITGIWNGHLWKHVGGSRGEGTVKTVNVNAKLTPHDVKAIRRRYERGDSQADIATHYGICQQLVSNICNYRAWRNVE